MAAIFLSNSRRNKVTGCQYRWFLEMVLGLRRVKEATALRLGSLWHAYMEKSLVGYFEGRSDTFTTALSVFESPEVRADEEVGPLCLAMAENAAPAMMQFLNRFRVLAVEVPFALRIVRQPSQKVRFPGFKVEVVAVPTAEEVEATSGRVLYYGGVIDAILQDMETGGLWVMEHKTTSKADQMAFEKDMDASFQVYGYLLAVQLLFPAHAVLGVVFDAARKKAPTVPKVNKCGCDAGQVKQNKKDAEAGVPRVTCPVCNGTGRGVFSATVIETTDAIMDAALAANPQLQHPDHAEYMATKYPAWRDECIRTSRPFWFQYYKPIREIQIRSWLADTWQVGRQYAALGKKKAEKEFCRHMDSAGCRMCSVRSLCLDGGEWDRSTAPEGYEAKPVAVVPYEVGRAAHGEEATPEPEGEGVEEYGF